MILFCKGVAVRVGNRILPQNWQEGRKDKRGFRTHQKCWGAVRAFFGTAIKWEEKDSYINTASVKHWWRSNREWRESIGFGGGFSKTRLMQLLRYKPQAVMAPSAPTQDDKTTLKRFCDESEAAINANKDKKLCNSEKFDRQLNVLEIYLSEWKDWLTWGDSPNLKICVASLPRAKKYIEKSILEARVEEIKDLQIKASVHVHESLNKFFVSKEPELIGFMDKVIAFDEEAISSFIHENDLSLPPFKNFSKEMEKGLQFRWILFYILKEMDFVKYVEKNKVTFDEKLKTALEKDHLAEAISLAETLSHHENKYVELNYNLKNLQLWLDQNPNVRDINLQEAQEKLKKRHLELMQLSLKYDPFKTDSDRAEISIMLHWISKDKVDLFHDPSRFCISYDLRVILDKLAKYSPKKFILNIKAKEHVEMLLKENSLETVFLNMIKTSRQKELDQAIKIVKEKIEKHEGLQNILDVCEKVIAKEGSLKEHWETLHLEMPELDPTIDSSLVEIYLREQFLKKCLKLLTH